MARNTGVIVTGEIAPIEGKALIGFVDVREQQSDPFHMSLDSMIETAIAFLRENGYTVTSGAETPPDLKAIQDNVYKLHHLVSAHLPPHVVAEAHTLLADIKGKASTHGSAAPHAR